MRGYYFITDSNLSIAGNISDVQNAVRAGVSFVQYREKDKDTLFLYREALQISEICRSFNTPFVVNDRIDIAMAVDADGVHLGQTDMPYDVARSLLGKKKIIGITVHNIEEAILAEKQGADYIGVAPIFSTATKKDAGEPCGLKGLEEIKKVCKIPVAAIGGINISNAHDVIKAGADMICAISAVVSSNDVFGEIEKFNSLFKK